MMKVRFFAWTVALVLFGFGAQARQQIPFGFMRASSACSGYSSGGYCYYLGAANADCDTTCASHGGSSLAGTQAAGSGGSDPICTAVMNGLGVMLTASGQNLMLSCSLGCVYYSGTLYRQTCGATDTSTANHGGAQRACACLN